MLAVGGTLLMVHSGLCGTHGTLERLRWWKEVKMKTRGNGENEGERRKKRNRTVKRQTNNQKIRVTEGRNH